MAIAAPVVTRVTLRAVLVSLTKLLACVVAIGIIAVADAFVRALFGTLKGAISWIPFAGKVVSSPVHKVEQKVVSYLGAVEKGLSKEIAAAFSQLAGVFVELSASILATAVAISALTWYVTKKISTAAIGQKATSAYLKALAAERATKRALQVIDRIESGRAIPLTPSASIPVRVAVKPIAQRIGRLERATDTRLDRLEAAIVAPFPRVGGRAGTRDRVARGELTRLWKWVRRHERTLAAGVGVATVLRALTRLKLGWLRCSNVTRTGKRLCGLDASLLDSLLAATLVISGTISIRELARELQDVTEFAAGAVNGFVRED